jgi:hypothetical protein
MGNKTMHHNEDYWKMRRGLVKDASHQIDEMQAEKARAEMDVKAEIIIHLQEIGQKTDEIVDKLNQLKDTNENTQENIKKRVKQAVKELRTAVSDALSRP